MMAPFIKPKVKDQKNLNIPKSETWLGRATLKNIEWNRNLSPVLKSARNMPIQLEKKKKKKKNALIHNQNTMLAKNT